MGSPSGRTFDPPALDAATPRELDLLLRWACAVATGLPPEGLPGERPRRTPPGAHGQYASALPMRLAGRARRPARELAADVAAVLRDCPQVVDARADGPGFVNLAVEPAARAALARVVADDPGGHLLGLPPGGRASAPTEDRPEWELSPLEREPDPARARERARADARRRIALATDPDTAAAALPPPPAEATWRDALLDTRPGAAATGAARLLAVIGGDSARVAFCRSPDDQVRPGESTGPDLPALPTHRDPGAWGRNTDANPAFAVRYAHAHAHTAHTRWASALGHRRTPADRPYTASAVSELTRPAAEALLGELFDGPAALRAAARRSEPHILVRYLEGLRAAYHEWWESRGAAPGRATGNEAGEGAGGAHDQTTAARLDTCAAVAGVLRTGLSLIGVSAPIRL
ncbi:DALR anticodon-binding domain-containing protein [Actinorugispora endophytica]|uniref:Arginyl-tRNA synthetase n=1 Tax=Actinorugispora endophytica TaxID=1605990 RepID=A0A4R6UP15_9ACTN|nr:DALR anticodon-binding domain-containing protein [Actinorugispora endophytica]TDQ47976.1 arginyl-tRNA synthetase [Actinorugispora endophytica]